MGRMSALHTPAAGLGTEVSVPPASRNGGSSNADVNGASIDMRGKRGALFALSIGALTGTAAVAARIQSGDNADDPDNANWTNLNYTAYPGARITNTTNANEAFEMSYVAGSGHAGIEHIRAVLTPEANISLAGITHIVY